jgi:tetratricopeptide (TPR) repeat protein
MKYTSKIKLTVWISIVLTILLVQTSFAAVYTNDLHNVSFNYDDSVLDVYKKGSLIVMLVPKGQAKEDAKEFPTFFTLKISKEIENFVNSKNMRSKLNNQLKQASEKYQKDYKKSRKIISKIDTVNNHPAARTKYIYTKHDENETTVLVDNLYLLVYDLKIEAIFSTQQEKKDSKEKKDPENKENQNIETSPFTIEADKIIQSIKFHKFENQAVEQAFSNGLLSLKDKKENEALVNFTQAVQLENHIECLYYKGVALSRTDKREEAIKILDQILEIKKNYDYAWGYKAFNYIRAKEMAKAWECYEKGIEANPDSEILYLDRALFKLSSKSADTKEVFDDLNKSLLINPFFPKAHYQFGVLSSLSGNQSMAAYCFQKAVAFDPENGDYWFMLGRILNSRREKAGDALECFDKALTLQPKNSRILVEKAKAHINLKDGNAALETLNSAIKMDRKEKSAWYIKGRLLTEAEKYKEAVTTYNRVLDMYPGDIISLISKSNIYRRTENWPAAEKMLENALEIEPSNIEALMSKAALFSKTKREKEAIEIYNAILRIDASNEPAKRKKAELIRALTF